jgi:hypothetical protein
MIALKLSEMYSVQLQAVQKVWSPTKLLVTVSVCCAGAKVGKKSEKKQVSAASFKL